MSDDQDIFVSSDAEVRMPFVPKILVIFATLILFLPFMLTTIVEFGNSLFDRIVGLG